jgi:hypothetical protein
MAGKVLEEWEEEGKFEVVDRDLALEQVHMLLDTRRVGLVGVDKDCILQ